MAKWNGGKGSIAAQGDQANQGIAWWLTTPVGQDGDGIALRRRGHRRIVNHVAPFSRRFGAFQYF